jgi:hypothetical protein
VNEECRHEAAARGVAALGDRHKGTARAIELASADRDPAEG